MVCDDHGVLLLNRFPCTNGHLLVAPREHGGDLASLRPEQRAGMMELATLGQELLARLSTRRASIWVNQVRCAGAGVPGHLHMYAASRWNGDTNFIHVCGQIRIVLEALEASYDALKTVLENPGDQYGFTAVDFTRTGIAAERTLKSR